MRGWLHRFHCAFKPDQMCWSKKYSAMKEKPIYLHIDLDAGEGKVETNKGSSVG